MLLNPKSDPLRITGIDSQFLSQLRPNDSIVLPRNAGKLVVAKVISDTELELKEAVKNNDKALQVLTTAEGSAYKCLPHVDQDAVYEKVYDELNNGECITIFPEGGSHDRAEMLPLKGKYYRCHKMTGVGANRKLYRYSWCYHYGSWCNGKVSWFGSQDCSMWYRKDLLASHRQ